ncbi:isochorismatase family protein [Plantibacter sp. LMC-P-059a]|uniref:isochorismatase family protein n=1 Tax=Plantibacter sp. LMC-P-059a TaxID=3040297 RepID=UPI002551381C|nr:isochorismatase family protein [Plantibacter sp. LMC-P-059a]
MARALFIIDVQNDFTEGGALGVTGGENVAAGITQLLAEHGDDYAHVFASRDWHDAEGDNGGHFAAGEPDYTTTWPVHCVAGSEGAEYHHALDTKAVDTHIRKGQGAHGYSIFEGVTPEGRRLEEVLADAQVTEVDVVGLATDYCVRRSALDAIGHGLQVRVLTELVAPVDEAAGAAALAEIAEAGGVIVTR